MINSNFLSTCEENFKKDKINIITRNAITFIGSQLTTINSERNNKINHVFMNSIKKKDVKATDQGMSGRCWLFSTLNMFRHIVIKALNLENFEFSEVYLFFYDKLEKSNCYLNWFINNPDKNPDDRSFDDILSYFMSDGGLWNYSANLIDKYGLMPNSVMKETWHSGDSEEMNSIIEEKLRNAVKKIKVIQGRKNRKVYDFSDLKRYTLADIHETLVKFLGMPPKSFEWSYVDDEEQPAIISGFTPLDFKNMLIPTLNLQNFVVLANIPNFKYWEKYEIKNTCNVEGYPNAQVINLPINELEKYAKKTITSGLGVWFAADVSKDFNPYNSVLDDELFETNMVFNRPDKFNKGERIKYGNVQANHAMLLTGLNIENGKPVSWQVENSWGYWDNETPGADGFLYMSASWFRKYVIEVVIYKQFLTRNILGLLNKDPIVVESWSSFGKCLKVQGMRAPDSYKKMIQIKKMSK